MMASLTVKWISLLASVSFSMKFSEAIICYDCTSWNPYCASSVNAPFPEAVATVECNITKTCFIRKESDGMISRGCADWWMFSTIVSNYIGCQEQLPRWMQPQEWCFCDTDYCNGQSMEDVKQLNGHMQQLHLQDMQDHQGHMQQLHLQDMQDHQDVVSDEEDSDSDEVDGMDQMMDHQSPVSTILPWWWWYVHWSTNRPYWVEGDTTHNGNNQKNNNVKVVSPKKVNEAQTKPPKTTAIIWWKNGKTTKLPDWWDVPAVPTGPVGLHGEKHENIQQNNKDVVSIPEASEDEINIDNQIKKPDFYCWDCYSDNPLCGEIVDTPVTYYVGRVACPITQKCFVRKDNGVIYRGCADGWKDSSIDYFYVGCKNQTMWDREVEWCFCSSPFCNAQSMNTMRQSSPLMISEDEPDGNAAIDPNVL